MDSLRLAPPEAQFTIIPCCRCGEGERHWDRIADSSMCPNCMEQLAVGEGEPLVLPTERRRCTICHQLGTIPFLTFPLQSPRPVELDVCGEHLRALVGRRLGPHAFEQLRRQLYALELDVGEVFLLHDAFYDVNGRALKPAVEMS